MDHLNTDPDRIVKPDFKEELNLLKFRATNGTVKIQAALGKKIASSLASEDDIKRKAERRKAMNKRSALRRKAKLEKAREAKRSGAKKAASRAAKEKYKNKKRAQAGSAAGHTTKKQKVDKGKGKAVAESDGGTPSPTRPRPATAESDSESDSEEDLYNEVDADDSYDSDSDSDSDGYSDMDDDIRERLKALKAEIADMDATIETRSPEDLWEHTSYVPDHMAAEFRETIVKKLQLQETITQGREMVDIKSYILSLPHSGFKWARIAVDEAQCLRNMYSSNSRIIRLLQGHALHLLTATPALNKIEDVKSFGSLA